MNLNQDKSLNGLPVYRSLRPMRVVHWTTPQDQAPSVSRSSTALTRRAMFAFVTASELVDGLVERLDQRGFVCVGLHVAPNQIEAYRPEDRVHAT